MEKPSAASAGGNNDNRGKRAPVEVPCGCRFDPTDEELMVYLRNKIMGGRDDLPDYISTADVFGTSPNQLPFDRCEYSAGKKWFFYTVGQNDDVFTGDGYWTPTSEEAICIDGQVDGYKKEFTYYCGTEHPGNRTNWYIHQFRLNPDVYGASAVGNNLDYKISSVVACMVFRKEAVVQSNRRKIKRKRKN
ncbi:NAC domain-containing protein 41 isoform X1 [Coffea arabica]|uniref:NAC domain-containing protein 41 isoform X1 n=1 Tax=Coffea arabica TaxID=13443 RepID=A0A6P6UHT0_COFAR|nr:NAC domain-containing protein 41-like isoform X1 [Coffea arabica]